MSSLSIGFIGLTAGFVLAALRVQIGVALGIASFFSIAAVLNLKAAWGMLTAVPFNFVGDWNLTAVPMFLLMGYIASKSGLSSGLFKSMRILLGSLPGGLAVTSVGACALLSAASGSSVATSAAFAKIATPEMLRYRYDPGLAAGVVASAGTLGSLIPPSLILIIYGYVAEVSIAKLFMAGIIPGILSAFMFAAMIIGRVSLNPALAPHVDQHYNRWEKIQALKELIPLPMIVTAILGGIYAGLFTPTEAGAIGAALTALTAWLKKLLSRTGLASAVHQTLVSTSSIFIVIIGTALLARFMALSGIPTYVAEILLVGDAVWIRLLVIVVILYLFLGCFVDSFSVILLTAPVILPMARELGVDLVYFGIILVKLLEIGLVTPPVGLNVFVIKGALGDRIALSTIFRGVGWFIAADMVTLTLLILFPSITLFLPNLFN